MCVFVLSDDLTDEFSFTNLSLKTSTINPSTYTLCCVCVCVNIYLLLVHSVGIST